MIDLDVSGLDAEAVASVAFAAKRAVIENECVLLQLAAHWADLHTPNSRTSSRVFPGMEQGKVFGGPGTPEVMEFAPAEFGAVQGLGIYAAGRMIGDALDLRHRLPIVWGRVCRGEIPAWKAREVAKKTRHLGPDQARLVDSVVARFITTLAWGRFKDFLDAKIIEADPEDAETRARAAAAERFVRTGQSNEHGIKTLYAKADAGCIIWFSAMLDRIALCLAWQGDTDPVDVRRAKAIGIIANPAQSPQPPPTVRSPTRRRNPTDRRTPEPARQPVQ